MKFNYLCASAVLLVVFATCVLCEENSPNFTEGLVTSIKHCLSQKEKLDCMKRKVIVKLENEIKNNRTIEISDGVYLKRDPNAILENSVMGNGRQFSTDVSKAKSSMLNSLLMSRIGDYFKSTVVQFKLSDDVDEARKKKGKGGAVFMYAAMGLATILSQLFLGKIALVSGAALMIAKISLVLAALTALKKLSSGGGGGGGGGEHVVYATKDEHGGSGWQRSGYAHELAYRGRLARQKKQEEFVPNTAYAYYPSESSGTAVS